MRRILFPIIALFILASCDGEKEIIMKEDQPFTFSVEIDTVTIDFKDRFYFMEIYLATATVSPDKKFLYNLNISAPNLEIIDLDKLELIEIEPMEKEGPKGIGPVVFGISITQQNELVVEGWNEYRVFDSLRTEMKTIKIGPNHLKGDEMEEGERFEYYPVVSDDGSHLYAIYKEDAGMKLGETKGLALVDLVNSRIRKIPIPELNSLKQFIIQNQYGFEKGESSYIAKSKNNLIVSTSAFNEAFVFDMINDTLIHKVFHSQLTSEAKKGNSTNESSSEEDRNATFKERSKEVKFGKFLYDEQNEKFWRFSYDQDRMIGDSIVLKTVLTIFDSDLNQLHEEKVGYDYSYYQSFFKDGMLYSYINLNDEMAFVRVKPHYQEF
ncbi:DUF4221 domain-containing protein [Algoriphagus machipongonensis]|uniref:Lipoprotein n=1 Tax=Algoriphagus machipongonensis TaxID=388413 RepID=A3HUC0_9BACT|nr:DUF4221 domain-containing protein [Algoriphagus machipongonensis]EAZ81742.2 hypothetical protein ALPR1_00835 [Algoriphagus machipongonensis]